MTQGTLTAREALRDLIDAYAYLSDDKKISKVMDLLTADIIYQVYMGGALVANVSGREAMEKDFNGHAAQVKTYFTMNGQHTVKVDSETATGISFSQLKMIREINGKDVLTDYSVKYEDNYVCQNGQWLIKKRIAHFVMVEARTLNQPV